MFTIDKDKLERHSVVFLDIDGVLNHTAWYRSKEYRAIRDVCPGEDGLNHRLTDLAPESVETFKNFIIGHGNISVVVSSTWRKDHDLIEIIRMLAQKGFPELKRYPVSATCSPKGSSCRGMEIQMWIEAFCDLNGLDELNRYVILDDDSDMLLWQAANFLNINHLVGLTEKDTYKAGRILRSRINTLSDS